MINFFRKIRKKLADDGKPLKYLRYAFGEILLVVVGILIALNINNWNENRKAEKLELKILKELKGEFTKNQVELDSAIAAHQLIKDISKELSEIIGQESVITDIEKFNKLASITIFPPKYDPSDGVLNAVISSGDLSLFENDELKYSLSSLSGLIKRYEHWVEVDYNNIIASGPIIIERYSLRNFPFVATLGQSKFEGNPHQLSRSLEFESYVVLRWNNAGTLKSFAVDIYEEQDKIIQLIDAEIQRLE